jgi:hypothetical protein
MKRFFQENKAAETAKQINEEERKSLSPSRIRKACHSVSTALLFHGL